MSSKIEEVDGIWFPEEIADMYRQMIESEDWKSLDIAILFWRHKVEEAVLKSRNMFESMRESGMTVDEIHEHPEFLHTRQDEHLVKVKWGELQDTRAWVIKGFLNFMVPAPFFVAEHPAGVPLPTHPGG